MLHGRHPHQRCSAPEACNVPRFIMRLGEVLTTIVVERTMSRLARIYTLPRPSCRLQNPVVQATESQIVELVGKGHTKPA
jgi:hypothetical protein